MRLPPFILFPILWLSLAAPAPAWAAQRRGKAKVEWVQLDPVNMSSAGGATFTSKSDGSVLVSGKNPARDTYTLEYHTELEGITAFRLEALPDPAFNGDGPGRSGGGNFVLTGVKLETSTLLGSRAREVPLENASASFSQNNWSVTGALDGLANTGWAIYPKNGSRCVAVFESPDDIRYAGGTRLLFQLDFQTLSQHTIGRFRISATTAGRPVRADSDEAWQGMPARIDLALAEGVDYLLAAQELDGSWDTRQKEGYRNGATGLALYALLKCKVPPGHPAIRRGIEFLRSAPPQKTYSAACQLIALTALGDPEHEDWIQELAELLIDWHKDGAYGYPTGAGDLSNGQYAVLALRAAAQSGVKVPRKTWTKVAQWTMRHQLETERGEPAPFAYNLGGKHSGGMTVAGIAILTLCEEQLGKRGELSAIRESKEKGLAWLIKHFSMSKEPQDRGGGNIWFPYYLYGIERVGALTGLDFLGGIDWYREGARFLVGSQTDEGSWTTSLPGDVIANTSFCLLFLAKATASSSGASLAAKSAYGADDPARDVSIRATGDTPLTVWVSSFGEDAIARYTWPEDEGGGLRVDKVEYVTSGRVLLSDGRTGAQEWLTPDREPAGNWFAPDFRDNLWKGATGAFGARANPNAVVRTEAQGPLYLRRTFELDRSELVEPVLVVNHTGAGAAVRELPSLVCLFDEDPDFPRLLSDGGASVVEPLEGDAAQGRHALRVTPKQRHAVAIPEWSFRIAEDPKPGEFRYVRFAWRKTGGAGVMLQLANQGTWGAGTLRYFAGDNSINFNPAIRVARDLPKRWTTVTRDLFEDGGAAMVTGIALTPMDGASGEFDAMYLARELADFKKIPKEGRRANWARVEKETVEASAPRSSLGTLRVWVNGALCFDSDVTTDGYQVVKTTGPPLGSLLQPGKNLIAVYCDLGDNDAIDIGLRDRSVLATVTAKRSKPAGVERFPARCEFPRVGKYGVVVRVHVVTPPEEDGATSTRVLESAPLEVQILEAIDEEVLGYARDPVLNLLPGSQQNASASSEFPGWPAGHVVDNLQSLGWLCADGDADPTLSIEVGRPVRANTILLSHPRPDRADADRTTRAQRVEVRINGGGVAHVVEMIPDDSRKTVLRLKKPQRVRRVDLRILDRTPGHPVKTAVGFSEIELQMRK